MLDIGWSEMLLIAVVAIVVIGPKELPRALRTIGQWIGKARALTRDLQNSVNDMIAESEMDELRKAADSMSNLGQGDILDRTLEDKRTNDTNSSAAEGYPTPPPTPRKWPPDDDDIDASDEELAMYADAQLAARGPDDPDAPEAEPYSAATKAIDEAEEAARAPAQAQAKPADS